MYWVAGAVTAILFFVSVLGHELAHSLVAIRQGEKVRQITLFVLGGVAQISDEPREATKEFYMALVGPLTSFALAGLFYVLGFVLLSVGETATAIVRYLLFINILLGAFNLLPGFPMDGGRILRALIWKVTGNLKKATGIASIVGQGFTWLFIVVGFFLIFRGRFINGIWIMMIGWFLLRASGQGYHHVVMREMLGGVRALDLMQADIQILFGDLSLQKVVDEFILNSRDRVFSSLRRGISMALPASMM
jgi:Zn-dependent protease